MDGVLLKPYPYPDPDRIVILQTQNRKAQVEDAGVSFLDMRDWKAANSSFSTIAATTGRSVTITAAGAEPGAVSARAGVSWDLFPLLGTPADPRAALHAGAGSGRAGRRVVLLSHDLWTRRYQADPADGRPDDRRQRRSRTRSSA